MALADKKSDPIHDKDGAAKGKLKDEFDAGHLTKIASNPDEEPAFAGVIYQIGLVQEDTGNAGADGSNGSNGSNGSTGSRGPTGNTGAAGTTNAAQLDASTLPTRRPSTRNLLWNDRGIVKIS